MQSARHSPTILMAAPEKSNAQLLAETPGLADCLFLVMHGIPFDVAFSLDEDQRLAWVVIIGEFHGGKFDWAARMWREK